MIVRNAVKREKKFDVRGKCSWQTFNTLVEHKSRVKNDSILARLLIVGTDKWMCNAASNWFYGWRRRVVKLHSHTRRYDDYDGSSALQIADEDSSRQTTARDYTDK